MRRLRQAHGGHGISRSGEACAKKSFDRSPTISPRTKEALHKLASVQMSRSSRVSRIILLLTQLETNCCCLKLAPPSICYTLAELNLATPAMPFYDSERDQASLISLQSRCFRRLRREPPCLVLLHLLPLLPQPPLPLARSTQVAELARWA